MDPLTNSLAAFVLGRTGLNRLAPRREWVLIAAANLPDLDLAATLLSPGNLLTVAGGPLHSLAMVPVLAGALSAAVWLASRRASHPVGLFLLAMAGLLLRLLLDVLPVYGIQLLFPFSDQWFALGILPYADPWLLLILSVFAFWPLLTHLVDMEIGVRKITGQGVAFFAILLAAGYCGYRAANVAEALSVTPNHNYLGEVPLREACYPNLFSLARVHCVLETDHHLAEADYFPGDDFDATEARILKKQDQARWQLAQYQSRWFARLEPRLRMPYWTVFPADYPAGASEAVLRDLVLAPEPYPLFTLRVLLDAEGRVLEESIRIQLVDWGQMEAILTP